MNKFSENNRPQKKGQVFYSESGSRWEKILWGLKIISVFTLVLIIIVAFTLFSKDNTLLPSIVKKEELYKKILQPDFPTTIPTNQNKNFDFNRQKIKGGLTFKYGNRPGTTPVKADSLTGNIRAGFYVNWDPQAYYSLITNIDKMNMVFTEWAFIADNSDSLDIDIDYKVLDSLRVHKVPIIVMVSNYYNQEWNGENLDKIFSSRDSQFRLIKNIVTLLDSNKFAGVNIDFESLKEGSAEKLLNFMKMLYTELHSRHYIVTQDVDPFNESYNLQKLEQYNDYIVVMAYDQHDESSVEGPIADEKWFEGALQHTMSYVQPDKIICGIAAYGYDWPKGYAGSEITYLESLGTANESEGVIVFDQSGYNLHYQYYDDNDKEHNVFFTDAVTNYNQIRSTIRYGIAGYAVWRLGAEDTRLWHFYNKDLSSPDKIKNDIDFSLFKTSAYLSDIDYEGDGEILEVISEPHEGKINITLDSTTYLIKDQKYLELPLAFLIKRMGRGVKQMILTFDDGPDPEYTPQILDILKEKNVKAAFFVVGLNAENNIPIIKRIYDEGHEIGNHTFTHPNIAEINEERANLELNATRRIIESVTSHSTVLFRPPYNADSEPQFLQEIIPVNIARKSNYYTVGESIDPTDWDKDATADSIFVRVVREQNNGSIILLHDAGGNRKETVKALPRIIDYFRSNGYNFISISDLLNVNRDKLMPPLQDKQDVTLSKINYFIVSILYYSSRALFAIFVLAIVLSIIRILFIGLLALRQKGRSIIEKNTLFDELPFVSIIVPAHNEEVNCVKTVNNLLKLDYPRYEICIVDDGSTDSTRSLLEINFSGNSMTKIFTKPNGGKASALNYGILHANGEILVCIDADTQLDKYALRNLVKYFVDKNVGAVAGNVKVGNEINLLTRLQSIEYTISQNFDRRTFDLLNCITVIPGAIGAFRKELVENAGMFTTDTLAEDCDLTIRLLKTGYVVRYSEEAFAYTEAPEKIKMFIKQRFRWTYGISQSLWKHKNALFNRSFGNLGKIGLPNILIFQIIMPLISPIADLFMIFSLFAGTSQSFFVYYAVFLFTDALVAIIAFRLEKQPMGKLWLLIAQRFIYRQIMYYIVVKAVVTAAKGSMMSWGIIKRTGSVRISEQN